MSRRRQVICDKCGKAIGDWDEYVEIPCVVHFRDYDDTSFPVRRRGRRRVELCGDCFPIMLTMKPA